MLSEYLMLLAGSAERRLLYGLRIREHARRPWSLFAGRLWRLEHRARRVKVWALRRSTCPECGGTGLGKFPLLECPACAGGVSRWQGWGCVAVIAAWVAAGLVLWLIEWWRGRV